MSKELTVIAHDVRSAHNIGAIFRTCEGLGVCKLYLSGISPYPAEKKDSRLPHVVKRTQSQIDKTALGADKTLSWEYAQDIELIIEKLKQRGFQILALEQNKKSISLEKFSSKKKCALIVGNEIDGIPVEVLAKCKTIIEIKMHGSKESLNVAQAMAIAVYQLLHT